jgi:hypothetical protein
VARSMRRREALGMIQDWHPVQWDECLDIEVTRSLWTARA